MSWLTALWLAACPPGSVSLVTHGAPNEAVRVASQAQLDVELVRLGLVRCDGAAPARVDWRWLPGGKVAITVETDGGPRSRTIEPDGRAVPLALAVFTGELLRELVMPEPPPPPPTPTPPPVEATSEVTEVATEVEAGRTWRLGASGEVGGFVAGQVSAGGGAVAAWHHGRLSLEVGLGALGVPLPPSSSGQVTAWGLLASFGGGVRLLGDDALGLALTGQVAALALRVAGVSTGAAQGLETWAGVARLRAGPQFHFEVAGLSLALAAGVGTWAPGLALHDGETRVGALRGLELWGRLVGGVAW